MSALKLMMVATRPVLCARGEFGRGEPLRARDDREFAEFTARPSWRRATSQDLKAWRDRLSVDPVLSGLEPRAKVEPDSEPGASGAGEFGKAIAAAAEADKSKKGKAGQKAAGGKSLVS